MSLNDFLSLSKLEEGIVRNNPEHLHISEFSKDIVEELKETARQHQEIIYVHKGSDDVIADKQMLKNILINLISNAIKYSQEGKKIYFNTEAGNDFLKIVIRDEGIGIPEEDQDMLFERFFRAHNAGNIQGTGLGLNIVKKHVELMQGRIGFTSALGKGTTFTIELPFPGKQQKHKTNENDFAD